MRLRLQAVRSLLLAGSGCSNPQLQQAAECLSQVPAALHTGCLPHLPGGAGSHQPEQTPAVQQPQQHSAAGRPQDYHAAALAEQPQWQDRQQQHQPQHLQLDARHAMQPPVQLQGSTAATHAKGLQQRHAVASQRHRPIIGSHTTSPASLQHSTSSALSAADGLGASAEVLGDVQEGAEYDTSTVFTLSSPEQQYRRTLAALHSGQSRNLDQLAHMLDPRAVLAAPDRGAAFLEAVMVAAAKLQDLQLLRQLLRCTAAAGNTLGSTGHRAVLQCLASCGRPVEALEWLQKRVPEQQLTPQLVRSLVQQLLSKRQVQAAQQALDYAERQILQPWQQGPHSSQLAADGSADAAAVAGQGGEQAAAGTSSPDAAAGSEVLHTLQRDVQELFSLRLLVAGAAGQVAAVQEQWAAIQAQAAALQQQQQGASQQDFLGVSVWAHYVTALNKAASRIGKRPQPHQDSASQQLLGAVWQVLDKYHAAAWSSYAAQQAAALQQGDQQGAAGAVLQRQQQWLVVRQHAAQQQWQHCVQSRGQLSWQQLDAAAVMPQEVAAAARFQDRQFCRHAWRAAMAAASRLQDGQCVRQLLAAGSLLKLVPQEPDFEELLQASLRQGAPPEALEELLGEMMSWGVIPTVSAYEAVMEAYALHRDLAPAEAVLDRMQAAGHQPVLRSFNRLLHGVALNGDLSAAIRVYNRLRLQGLQPDMQTMRALFKCVRMYATNVRVATARSISQSKAGDRETTRTLLGQRAALFASAYSQLVLWQRDMVTAGLKHTSPSLKNLAYALERLGASEDCLQLARLAEEARPGDHTAHRAALKVVARTRDVHSAGQASRLLAQLASQGEPLTREDYLALISSQFWLKQDHEQLLQTVAAMKAAGHVLDQHVLQQLLHVYCHCGMWGEALQVLNDVAAGRFSPPCGGGGSSSSSDSRQAPGAAGGSRHGSIDSDQLWHVVLRKLWEKRAADELLNEFLKHMSPAQLQRFKYMYGLQPIPGQEGRLTLRPLEDWQLPLQQQQQQQQQQQKQQQQEPQQQQLQQQARPEAEQEEPEEAELGHLHLADVFGPSAHPSLAVV